MDDVITIIDQDFNLKALNCKSWSEFDYQLIKERKMAAEELKIDYLNISYANPIHQTCLLKYHHYKAFFDFYKSHISVSKYYLNKFIFIIMNII